MVTPSGFDPDIRRFESYLPSLFYNGGVDQLVDRVIHIHVVIGSIPISSSMGNTSFNEKYHYTIGNKENNCFNCVAGGNHYVGGCICHEKQCKKSIDKVVDPDGKCDLWVYTDIKREDYTKLKGD